MNGTVPAATALPLRAAAARMGISTDTLRKRLQRGLTPGRKVDGSWLVEVPDAVLDGIPDPVPGATAVQDGPGPAPAAPREPPGGALAVQRAQEMAEYTERLLAPWRAIVQAQAEELGALKAHLAAQTQSAPSAGRSWWRRLWGLP